MELNIPFIVASFHVITAVLYGLRKQFYALHLHLNRNNTTFGPQNQKDDGLKA